MKLEEALKLYYDKFNENYPLGMTDCDTDDKIISDIAFCLESGEKAKEVEYDENDY